MTVTPTQNPGAFDINQATLAQLGAASVELWSKLENCDDQTNLSLLYDQLLDLQNATEEKIDAIAYVADQFKQDLEMWQERLKRVTEYYTAIIGRRKNQLSSLKSYLLRLHQLGLLPDKLYGSERRIDFQDSPASVIPIVEPEHLPPQFQEVKIEAKTKEILAAHAAGQDVSEFAEVVVKKHVRFYHQSKSRARKKK